MRSCVSADMNTGVQKEMSQVVTFGTTTQTSEKLQGKLTQMISKLLLAQLGGEWSHSLSESKLAREELFSSPDSLFTLDDNLTMNSDSLQVRYPQICPQDRICHSPSFLTSKGLKA